MTTTAKQPHPWEFFHDEVGYNYRMPNINATVGCAQMESFAGVLENKRTTAQVYNLPMYSHCQCTSLDNAQWLEDRLVNIPSSVRI